MHKTKLTIFMIATNSYTDLWKICIQSIIGNEELNIDLDITFTLATNKVNELKTWFNTLYDRDRLTTIEIPPYGWPEATLFRYKILMENSSQLNGDIVMYLDCDMLVVANFSKEIMKSVYSDKLFTVAHPGYFVGGNIKNIFSGIFDPKIICSATKSIMVLQRGLGDWESNNISTAFVPKHKRKKYVHGAIWFGKKKTIIELCGVLNERIELDLKLKYIAKWHDESHLNWYVAERLEQVSILNPTLSWHPFFKNIKHLKPMIANVAKNNDEIRKI